MKYEYDIRRDGPLNVEHLDIDFVYYYNLNKYTDALFFIKGAYQLDNQNSWYKKLLAKLYSINSQYSKPN